MKKILVQTTLVVLIFMFAIPPQGTRAQAPANACGTQAFCVDTADFTATVTSFRTSVTTSNVKIIDATVRFQNKTNQPLILGYAVNSGMATDDRGNRLVVGGPNGYRGIGVVAGTNFEPKFVVRPGSYGDAQFELIAQGWPKLVGFTHALDLTVNEINSYEGNQHTLGGEFPLHFQGLTNGSAGSPPVLGALSQGMQGAGAGPCGLAGAQGAAGKASTTVSNAANTISNLGSLFGRKKASQNANQVSNAAAGCDPRVNDVANKAGMVAGLAANANQQNGAAVQAAQAQMSQPRSSQTLQSQMMQAATNAQADSAAAAAAPSASTGNTPANMAADGYARLRQKMGRKANAQTAAATASAAGQGQSQPASPQMTAQASAPADPYQNQKPGNPMAGADMQGAQLQESEPSASYAAANKAVTATKYDILGIRLGMPAKEAVGILRSRQMQISPETVKYAFLGSPLTYGLVALNPVMYRNNAAQPNAEKVYLMLTMPPNQQVVSKVSRYLMFSKETAPTNDGLVADLVKKYGQPSYDSHPANLYQRGYRELFWIDDASGHRLLNQTMSGGGYSVQISNCRGVPSFAANDVNIEADPVAVKGRLEEGYDSRMPKMYNCADLTVVYAKLFYGYPIGVSSPDVVGGLLVMIGSGPLDRLSTDASHEYLLKAAKAHDMQQKSAAQKNKPAL